MCVIVLTCLMTCFYLCTGKNVICTEGQQKVKVTQNETTWDVNADIEASICSWILEAENSDRVVVLRPSGDPELADGCQRFSVRYSPDRSELLCGEFWSSERSIIVDFTPPSDTLPSDTISFHFNITYYSKNKDDYSSKSTFSVYPSPSLFWIAGSSTPESNSSTKTSIPSLNWLLKAEEACIELAVLHEPTFQGLVHVHDGNDELSPEIGVCGTNNPATISGTGNTLYVRTDTSINSTTHGFWLSFKSTSTCDGDVIILQASSDAQKIISPNISDAFHVYPVNVRCRWIIQSSDRKYVIKMDADHSDLESSYKCVNDSLAAFDFQTDELISRWCGQTEPSLLSSYSTMLLEFTSDMSVVKSGFRLEYYTRRKVACGGTHLSAPTTGYRRVFTSPGYPSYYPNNMQCEWEVRSDSAYYGVRLEITMVNLERTSDGQCVDYLQVIGGGTAPTKLCTPAHTGKMYEASQYELRVVFHSNANTTFPGFKITYYSFPKSTNDFGCKAKLNASENTQDLFSPAYPQDYPNNLHCSWVFQSSKTDSIVVIDVVDSRLEISPVNEGECSADYGIAYDGPDDTYPELGRWCGLAQPTFRSRGQFLNLVFVTDTARRFRGFQLKYYTMKDFKFCPYRRVMKLAATTRIKYFNSPNYPDGYPSNIDCRWLISAPNASMVVKVIVVEADMEKSPVCSFDVVRVYDGKSASFDTVEVGYFCGSSTPQYKSTQQHMYLEFTSDASTNKRGFKIMYQAVRVIASKNSSIVGIIIGGILGGVAVIAAVATITVLIARRHRQSQARQQDTARRRAENIVVNVNRTDNTVFFMSPVFFSSDSTDHLELGEPPPYPGLPNDAFHSDAHLSYELTDLPPPYSEIDSNTSLISNAMNSPLSTSPDPYADSSRSERQLPSSTATSPAQRELSFSDLRSTERTLPTFTVTRPTEREISFSNLNISTERPLSTSTMSPREEVSFSTLRSSTEIPSTSTAISPSERELSFSNLRSRERQSPNSAMSPIEGDMSFSTIRSSSERDLLSSALRTPRSDLDSTERSRSERNLLSSAVRTPTRSDLNSTERSRSERNLLSSAVRTPTRSDLDSTERSRSERNLLSSAVRTPTRSDLDSTERSRSERNLLSLAVRTPTRSDLDSTERSRSERNLLSSAVRTPIRDLNSSESRSERNLISSAVKTPTRDLDSTQRSRSERNLLSSAVMTPSRDLDSTRRSRSERNLLSGLSPAGDVHFSALRTSTERDLFSTQRSQSERNLATGFSFSTVITPEERETPDSGAVVYRQRVRPSPRQANRDSRETSV